MEWPRLRCPISHPNLRLVEECCLRQCLPECQVMNESNCALFRFLSKASIIIPEAASSSFPLFFRYMLCPLLKEIL